MVMIEELARKPCKNDKHLSVIGLLGKSIQDSVRGALVKETIVRYKRQEPSVASRPRPVRRGPRTRGRSSETFAISIVDSRRFWGRPGQQRAGTCRQTFG